jgi:hypothetical protein
MPWFPLSNSSFIPHERQVVLELQEALLIGIHWQSVCAIVNCQVLVEGGRTLKSLAELSN